MIAVMSELSPELLAAVDNMPAFPKSAQAILALTQDTHCSPKDLARVIEKDPVVTVKVLRVVNSAYYRLPDSISSIDHALVFLGMNTVKNLALGLSAVSMVQSHPLSHFDAQRYLVHSLLTAALARKLARGADANDCFIAGLLHDFGKVVIAHAMPQLFCKSMEMSYWKPASLHQTLVDFVHVDDAAVAARLIEKWNFPDDLVQTIRHQNQPHLRDTPIMACLVASIQISQHLGFGFGGQGSDTATLPDCVAKRLGGNLTDILRGLEDLSPLLEDVSMYAKTDPTPVEEPIT